MRATASGLLRRVWPVSALGPLGRPVGRAVAGLNERRDGAGLDRRIDLERAGDDEAGLVGHRQRLKRVALREARRPSRRARPAPPPWRETRARSASSRPRGAPPRSSAASTRPRPGSLRRMSGTTEPSGPSAKRSIASGASLRPSQCRSAPTRASSFGSRSAIEQSRRCSGAFASASASGSASTAPAPRSSRRARARPGSWRRPARARRRSR